MMDPPEDPLQVKPRPGAPAAIQVGDSHHPSSMMLLSSLPALLLLAS